MAGRAKSSLLLVSDAPLPAALRGFPRVTADRYLEGDAGTLDEGLTVLNLCRSYSYLSRGYYVSLVAEARRQRVLPHLEAIEGANNPFSYFRVLQEAGVRTLDFKLQPGRRRLLPRQIASGEGADGTVLVGREEGKGSLRFERTPGGWLDVTSCFGFVRDRRFRQISAAVYRAYPFPLLRIRLFDTEEGWRVGQLQPVSLPGATPEELVLLAERLARGPAALAATAPPPPRRYRLAVLWDPNDPVAPSGEDAVDRLARAGARRGLIVERLGKNELGRLAEYDALFLRTVTAINHVSYTFSQTAASLGIPVIDDPASIIKCSNKIFLYELFRKHGLPMPDTTVLSPRNWREEVRPLGWPVVLKVPDGTFSLAVKMARSEAELEAVAKELFRRTPLLLAQRFTPSDFDWRVGVLEGRVVWTARYHMAPGHWQIADRSRGGATRFGRVEAVPVEACPEEVRRIALAGTALIGDGLYGVDIKETDAGPVLIEINDNPNLEAGYEDAADRDAPYDAIVDAFLRRIEGSAEAGAPGGTDEGSAAAAPPPSAPAPPRPVPYDLFEVVGIELEYPIVGPDLAVRHLVEDAFRRVHGRPTSDLEHGGAGFSNELADHVFELKTLVPAHRLVEAERVLAEGVRFFNQVLAEGWDARLLPTGMHPFMAPEEGRLWRRSGRAVYATYDRVFGIRGHGWLNVQSCHVNLPFGRREEDTVRLHNAICCLLPYLPALTASSPVVEGRLGAAVDNRLAFYRTNQARVPQVGGQVVPEYMGSTAGYKRDVLGGIYRALEAIPEAARLRHEWVNSRGAIVRFSRRAIEVRVLDVQECPKMDVAVAAFLRGALARLVRLLAAADLELPNHHRLVADYEAVVAGGSGARVTAPHLRAEAGLPEAASEPEVTARQVLLGLLPGAREELAAEERPYLDLVETRLRTGNLSERIRRRLKPLAETDREAEIRAIYEELVGSLATNTVWTG